MERDHFLDWKIVSKTGQFFQKLVCQVNMIPINISIGILLEHNNSKIDMEPVKDQEKPGYC